MRTRIPIKIFIEEEKSDIVSADVSRLSTLATQQICLWIYLDKQRGSPPPHLSQSTCRVSEYLSLTREPLLISNNPFDAHQPPRLQINAPGGGFVLVSREEGLEEIETTGGRIRIYIAF